jgi:hypothetical protein
MSHDGAAGEGKSITIRHLDLRQTLGVHDLVLSTPGRSLNPFTVTAADLDQGKEAGDQDGSKEDGCEEEKRYRKHIHARKVKILESAETMGDVLSAPNGFGKTLRTDSVPCNVVLRSFRMFPLEHCAERATLIGFNRIDYFDHSASSERLACSVGGSPTGGKVRNPVAGLHSWRKRSG